MKKSLVIAPLVLTVSLLVWTALVYKTAHYGSWHIYPALAVLPLAILYHVALIIFERPRHYYVAFAVLHIGILFPLWFLCLMLISKDSW